MRPEWAVRKAVMPAPLQWGRLLLLVAALACISCQLDTPPVVSAATVAALLAQRDAITNWAAFSAANSIKGWNTSSPMPVCRWTGVRCNVKSIGGQNVTNIFVDLQCFRLPESEPQGLCALMAQGKLAPELASISTLVRLFLAGHELTGSVPDAWGATGAFPSLVEMWLNDNKLTGSLPESWGSAGKFGKLEYLNMAANGFTGVLPEGWASAGALRSLEFLDVSRCKLTGTLPAAWGNQAFKSLASLALQLNALTGPLPSSWGGNGAFPAVYELYLRENRLTGTLPDAWGGAEAFPTLVYLDMESNSLTGSLPEAWGAAEGAFPFLEELVLPTNKLTGTLPASWGSPSAFPSLRILYLDNTGVSGPIPETWGGTAGAFPSLVELGLSVNKLNGTFPAWGNPEAFPLLELLDIESNRITGTLPSTWGSGPDVFPSLIDLDVSDCNLSGTLPSSWGEGAFQNLTILNLESNSFTGGVPLQWGSEDAFPSLKSLLVSKNPVLCGSSPASLTEKAGLGPLPACAPPPSPAASPPPSLPPPGSPPPSPDTSSSSTSVGAIVGGVLGGLAIVGLLAFLALRPGKGWLRKRQGANKAQFVPPPGVLDSIITSPSDPEKGSLDSMVGLKASLETNRASTPATASGNSRQRNLDTMMNDPVLSYIASSLATLRQNPHGQSHGARAYTELTADMQQWAVDWDEITLERPIGQGSFGLVYFARWKQTPVACKVLINKETMHGGLELPTLVVEQLQQEACVMAKMRHPNIVNFVGLCTLPPCILTEYCQNGSLYCVLREAALDPVKAAELTWKLRISMALDAARGLLYLHSMSTPIIHRDIKSPNLLVDKSFTVKVSDFNLSKILSPVSLGTNSMEGANNPTWLAPEVLAGGKESAASDVFAFGMILLEFITWQLPWAAISNHFQVAQAVMAGQRPDVPALDALPGPDKPTNDAYTAYCQLMRDCWEQDASARPPSAEIVARLASIEELA